MNRRLRAWWNLPSAEKLGFLWILIGLPMVSLLLRLAGYVRARCWLERLSSRASPRRASAADLQAAERLAQLIDIAGRRGLVNATCLRQALLIHFLLRRRGFSPELKIGVRREQARLDAHAWVELQGMALGQPKLAHQPFPKAAKGTTKIQPG